MAKNISKQHPGQKKQHHIPVGNGLRGRRVGLNQTPLREARREPNIKQKPSFTSQKNLGGRFGSPGADWGRLWALNVHLEMKNQWKYCDV